MSEPSTPLENNSEFVVPDLDEEITRAKKPITEEGMEETLHEIPKRTEQSPARLVIVSTIYHQLLNENAQPFSHKISKPLTTDEQVYTRRIKVTKMWRPLDIGWLTSLSLVYITNEEQQTNSSAVVELGIKTKRGYPLNDCPPCPTSIFPTPIFLIGPGGSFNASPCDCSSLYLRCQSDVAKVTINAFPG